MCATLINVVFEFYFRCFHGSVDHIKKTEYFSKYGHFSILQFTHGQALQDIAKIDSCKLVGSEMSLAQIVTQVINV
jgi:hypothetical protein